METLGAPPGVRVNGSMSLRELLVDRRTALCGRWLEAILGEYGAQTATKWVQVQDPFANPVGHSLKTGLPELFDAVICDGEPAAGAVTALEGIIRIRSVQGLAPSRAVGFVFLLRDVVRGELVDELAGGAHAAELAAVDRRVEQLAMLAFDTYVRIRDQVFSLRQEELKRSVASLLRRWHGSEHPEPDSEVVQLPSPPNRGLPR